MCDLRRVRQYLTDEAAMLVSNALVSSRLDYCNSLFKSLSNFNLCKLQCIQNTLAKIVTNFNKYSQIYMSYSQISPSVPSLISLHL